MGKNQAYKAMQRARLGSSSAGPEEVEDGMEDELKRDELEADKDRMMREYRAQLDAERARKLSLGKSHSASKSHRKKGISSLPCHHDSDRKDKDSKKRSCRKRKHKRSSESSSSGSSSESSSSDDDYDDSEREPNRSRSKRSKKKRKHRSRVKHSSSDHEENGGPVRLSKFFGSVKR